MPFPAPGTFAPSPLTALTPAQLSSGLEAMNAAAQQLPGGGPPALIALASHVLVPTSPAPWLIEVDSEGGTGTDYVNTIQNTQYPPGSIICLIPANYPAHTITVKNMAGGVGQIHLSLETDLVLNGPLLSLLLFENYGIWQQLVIPQNMATINALTAQFALFQWFLNQLAGGTDGVYQLAGASGASSFACTVNDSMTVTVASGALFAAAVLYAWTGPGSVTFTAPATHPRVDLITYVLATGAVHSVTGVEQALLTPSNMATYTPATPAGEVLLATVFLRPGSSMIRSANDNSNGFVTDARTFVNA
jgi:hypothetical protein